MKGAELAVAAVGVAALLSFAVSGLPQLRGSGTPQPPWALLVAVGAFGFVGRQWLLSRLGRKGSPAPKPWNRRRRALPPAPEPVDRAPVR